MLKTEIKYGLLTGIGICFWILAEYFLGFHTDKMEAGEYAIYFVVIIPLFTIFFGLREKRDLQYGGKISVGNGLKAGLMISLIAAIIVIIFLMLYLNYINPDYSELGVAYYKKKMMLSNRINLQDARELESIKQMFSFINQLLFGVIGTVGTGLFISFAVSLYFKKGGIIRKKVIS